MLPETVRVVREHSGVLSGAGLLQAYVALQEL